jgi:rhodanese-related sulfurtransferase
MGTSEITKDMTMEKILSIFPGAQRALFQKYHIGGCSSCGFNPQDTLETVCQNHDIKDTGPVIEHLTQSAELDEKIQISPQEVSEKLKAGNGTKLLDVRDQTEWDRAHIDGAQLATQELIQEIMKTWPKNTEIITHCHFGMRSMDAASYLIGHGFTEVKSMRGGIDAWSKAVDSSIPQYQ